MNIDISKLVAGPKSELADMLGAMEQRQEIQQKLIEQFHLPVISFTLNIVGPVKVFPLATKTFHEGVRLIDSQLHAGNIPVSCTRCIKAHTGYEHFWAVNGNVDFIKETLCLLEDSLSFGRLFDIDVIRPNGQKISRTELGYSARTCLICNRDAFICGRARTHSVHELLEKECQLMEQYFAEQYTKKLSSLSMQALLYEVSVTPKPGLVDRNNTGAHRDMDIFTFEASAVSLNYFFEKFAYCGLENSHEPFSRIFARLRSLGIQAEDSMMTATCNINTHKGLIFSLAVMNCSLGYMYAHNIPYSPDKLLEINQMMVADVLKDFKNITIDHANTNGERLYARYGLKGARGEALSGYYTVLKIALPILKTYIEKGVSINDAGAITLLHIIAHTEDTNIVNRSSYKEMKDIQEMLIKKLNDTAMTVQSLLIFIEQLDHNFIGRNISPGGSADLLALTYFIFLFEKFFYSAIKNTDDY